MEDVAEAWVQTATWAALPTSIANSATDTTIPPRSSDSTAIAHTTHAV